MKTSLTAFLFGIAFLTITTAGIATAQPYGPGSGYRPRQRARTGDDVGIWSWNDGRWSRRLWRGLWRGRP